MKRRIEKARQWSAENNDGNPDLSGLMFTEHFPRYIEAHEKSAKHFRLMAKRGAK